MTPSAGVECWSTSSPIPERNLCQDGPVESEGSPDKRAFMDIARERGMREAIAWRDARFDKAQQGG